MDDVIIQVWCLCVIFWQFQILSRAFYGLCINSIRCKTGGNYLAVCYEYIPSAIFISPLNQVHAIAKKHLKCVSTNSFKLKCYSYVIHRTKCCLGAYIWNIVLSQYGWIEITPINLRSNIKHIWIILLFTVCSHSDLLASKMFCVTIRSKYP